MDEYRFPKIGDIDDLQDKAERIMSHLKSILPDDVYSKWVEHFVFERIDERQVVIAYCGNESLKEFKKEHKETVWIHICSVIGYVKKIKIYEKKADVNEDDFPVPEIEEKPKKITRGEKKTTEIPKENADYAVKGFSNETKNKIKTAKLLVLSMIFFCIMLCVAVTGLSYISNHNFRETFYSVSSLKANSKIRIVQISDLHSKTYGKDNKRLIERVKKLKPDLIIYTGDIIDSGDKEGSGVFKLCTELSEVAPSYFIYGNNEVERVYPMPLTQDALDEKFGFKDEQREPDKLLEMEDKLEEKLSKSGVKVLKNESDTITVKNTEVEVFGVLNSNPSSFWSYAGESFDEYAYKNTKNLKITAIHEPFIFEEYDVDFWGDVMLCGHTHGGTVKLPVLGPLYTHEGGFFPQRAGYLVYGRYDISGKPLIVSSGLDRGIFRINNKPELVIIDINRF